MSFGKSSSYTTPELTQEQKDMIKAQTQFFTGTVQPTYTEAVKGATDIYNQNAGGVLNAAQQLAGTARQAGQTFGETGESALRTGTSGLESLFSPDYEANQIAAAMAPAQAQYLLESMTFYATGSTAALMSYKIKYSKMMIYYKEKVNMFSFFLIGFSIITLLAMVIAGANRIDFTQLKAKKKDDSKAESKEELVD